MRPSVSILIPCYNAGRWIGASIESALENKGPQDEVIVVDDGSTDGSLEIIQSFGDRIRWEAGDHRGGCATRNRLVELSTGEWLQFLDADDYLLPGKIEAQLREAPSLEAADVLYSQVQEEEWLDGRPLPKRLSPMNEEADLCARWINWDLPQTGGALWKKSSLLRIGGWNLRMPCCQEHELYLRAIQAGLRFERTPTAGAVYRIWSSQTVCQRDPVQLARIKTGLIENMLSWLESRGELREIHRRYAGEACFAMARRWMQEDPAGACAYHDALQKRGLMRPAGAPAPWHYRVVYRLFGFRAAEELARRFRRIRKRGA
jgi:glycosyltransferase involved in cell wall biosynthesis